MEIIIILLVIGVLIGIWYMKFYPNNKTDKNSHKGSSKEDDQFIDINKLNKNLEEKLFFDLKNMAFGHEEKVNRLIEQKALQNPKKSKVQILNLVIEEWQKDIERKH